MSDPRAHRGLGALASRGAVNIMGGQIVRLAVQIAGVTVLARLLAPTDYGLVAMVVAIIGVAELVRDLGLSSAAIQAETLSRDERDNLFWLNTGLGAALTIAAAALSPLIALLYDEPRLVALTVALSSVFFINGVSTQYRAGLSRDLRLGVVALADVLGAVLGLAAGIAGALLGFGYWSLAAQQIVQAVVQLVVVVSASRWLPRGIHRRVSVRPFLRFGSGILFTQLLTYASRNVDTVVIGSSFGASALGIYNRAFTLLMLPLNQLNAPASRVALPVLARLQDQTERFGRFLITGQTLLLHLVLAVFSFAIPLAGPLVEIALGPNWAGVVPLFEILAVGGIFQALTYATSWIFLARRLTRSMIVWSIVTKPPLIVAVVVGSLWGVEGVASAFAITNIAFWPLSLLWFARDPVVPTRSMLLLALRSLVMYGFIGVCAGACAALAGGQIWPSLLWGAAGWLIGFGITMIVPVCRRDVALMIEALRLSRGGSRA